MSAFTFIINTNPNAKVIDTLIFIDLDAENWDALASNQKITGDPINVSMLKSSLKSSFCLHGELFNPMQYSPRKLYEAILLNNDWKIEKVIGDVPEDPTGILIDLPEGSIL